MGDGLGVGVGAGVGVGGGGGTVPMSIVTVTLFTERCTPAGMTRLTDSVKSPVMPPSGIGNVLMVDERVEQVLRPGRDDREGRDHDADQVVTGGWAPDELRRHDHSKRGDVCGDRDADVDQLGLTPRSLILRLLES